MNLRLPGIGRWARYRHAWLPFSEGFGCYTMLQQHFRAEFIQYVLRNIGLRLPARVEALHLVGRYAGFAYCYAVLDMTL